MAAKPSQARDVGRKSSASDDPGQWPANRKRGLLHSFRNAGLGVVRTVATQRNMKIHTVSAAMVMIFGMTLPLDLASRTALLFCVALVFFAEILNTALESFVDLHVRAFRREAMMAKDAAAAGVLVLAVATVVIMAAILHHQWNTILDSGQAVLRSVALGTPILISMGFLLWGARRTITRFLLVFAALGLAVPLWIHSTNPLFSICLFGVLLLAAVARPN